MSARARTRVEVTGWMIVAVLLTVMMYAMFACVDDETLRVEGPTVGIVREL